jgi:hypothetical protein
MNYRVVLLRHAKSGRFQTLSALFQPSVSAMHRCLSKQRAGQYQPCWHAGLSSEPHTQRVRTETVDQLETCGGLDRHREDFARAERARNLWRPVITDDIPLPSAPEAIPEHELDGKRMFNGRSFATTGASRGHAS